MAWMRAAAAAEIKDRGVMGVELGGEEIALYWVDDAPYATENICTHAFARLSEGFLDGGCFSQDPAVAIVKEGRHLEPSL